MAWNQSICRNTMTLKISQRQSLHREDQEKGGNMSHQEEEKTIPFLRYVYHVRLTISSLITFRSCECSGSFRYYLVVRRIVHVHVPRKHLWCLPSGLCSFFRLISAFYETARLRRTCLLHGGVQLILVTLRFRRPITSTQTCSMSFDCLALDGCNCYTSELSV